MNYGDKHTEDSLCSRLGRLYGIKRGLDCGPNILMNQYRDENGWVYRTRAEAEAALPAVAKELGMEYIL